MFFLRVSPNRARFSNGSEPTTLMPMTCIPLQPPRPKPDRLTTSLTLETAPIDPHVLEQKKNHPHPGFLEHSLLGVSTPYATDKQTLTTACLVLPTHYDREARPYSSCFAARPSSVARTSFQNFPTEAMFTRSSGEWAPSIVGPKLTCKGRKNG